MRNIGKCLISALIVGLLPAIAWAGPVNINTADAATLAKELDGIGMARARAIVEYRDANGPFASLEDVLKVKGVGHHVLEQNRASILFESTGSSKE